MSLVSIQNVGLAFGDMEIFAGISVNLPNGGKVGLVGPNGVGKTSILRFIAGIEQPTSGSIHRARGTRLGYLRQEAVEAFAGTQHSVYDEMLTVFSEVRAAGERLRDLERAMANGSGGDDLLGEYGQAQHAFEHAGGYDYDVRIQQVLEGLGFPAALWQTPIQHCSGGQKTRALLARLLLEEPDLLILDEPTNHLDMEAVAWLEQRLRQWEGALIVVSHDRYFLDTAVDRIWEMSPRQIESYRGNYSAYVLQRQERWERSKVLFEREMERLEKEMEVVRRYHAWRKFEERDGRLKRLGRELMAIEKYGILGAIDKEWSEVGLRSARIMSVDEAHRRIKEIRPPVSRPAPLRLRLDPVQRSGDIVLRTHNLFVGYDGEVLVDVPDVHLTRGERIAVIGPNGSGKTTLLRTLVGELEPVRGEVHLGAAVTIGYFAQAHDGLDGNNTVLDEVLQRRDMEPGEARKHLAAYLFRGDDVFKTVSSLSGGERARLALAVLALKGVNFLLLDEPTNHLDIPAQEVLQESLEGFAGTLLLVSHDRYLVDHLASTVWEVGDARLQIFHGRYSEMMAQRESASRLDKSSVRPPVPVAAGSERKGSDKDERRRLRLLAAIEGQISEAEAALAGYTSALQAESESGDYVKIGQLSDSYAETQARLDLLLLEWAGLVE